MNDRYKHKSEPQLLTIVVYVPNEEYKRHQAIMLTDYTIEQLAEAAEFNARVGKDLRVKGTVVAIGLAYSEGDAIKVVEALGVLQDPDTEYNYEWVTEERFNNLVETLELTNVVTFGY